MAAVDVPDDRFGVTMSEGLETHEILMTETAGNIAHNHNIARSVSIIDYREPGAIEAAAAAVVLRIKPLTS